MQYKVSFTLDFKRNPYPGKFIAIEGIDGSGKTTQAKRVVDELQSFGTNALYTKEPTGEPTGKFIRQVLSEEIKVPPISLQYLYGADRAVHLEKVEELLEKGKTVITDRYFWSSVAYGISDLGEIGDYYLTAFSILSHYHQFLIPDKSFYLQTSVDTAVKRIDQTGKKKEIYEHREKLEKIAKGYEWLIKKFPEEITVISGEQSVENVTQEILNRLPK